LGRIQPLHARVEGSESFESNLEGMVRGMTQDEQRYPATNKYNGLTRVYQITNEHKTNELFNIPSTKDELTRMLEAVEFLTHFEKARSEFLEAAMHYTGWGWGNMTTADRKRFVKYFLSDYPMDSEPAEIRRRRELKEERADKKRINREQRAWLKAHPLEKA